MGVPRWQYSEWNVIVICVVFMREGKEDNNYLRSKKCQVTASQGGVRYPHPRSNLTLQSCTEDFLLILSDHSSPFSAIISAHISLDVPALLIQHTCASSMLIDIQLCGLKWPQCTWELCQNWTDLCLEKWNLCGTVLLDLRLFSFGHLLLSGAWCLLE